MLALDASVAIEENRKLIAEIAALKEASISPLGLDFELQMLRDENTELKQTLERQNLSSREEGEKTFELFIQSTFLTVASTILPCYDR